MSTKRRVSLAAYATIASAALIVTACGGSADGGTSDPGSGSSATSSSSAPTEPSTSTDTSTTPDPYAIDCSRLDQAVIDVWTEGAEPATSQPTERGCRVVSSSAKGALLVEWRYLDVPADSGDTKLIREIGATGMAVDLTKDISAVRSESDVDPTRKTRSFTTYVDGRTLYIEATATLDRPVTMADLRRMTVAVATTYKDRLGPSTTTD